MDSLLTATAASALPVLMVWAGAVDILTRAIPNRVTMTLAACFGLFAGASGLPLQQVAAHALCAIAVLAFGYFLYSRSWFGGGDAKLLAAAALWFGFDALLPFLAATALAGGVLALCLSHDWRSEAAAWAGKRAVGDYSLWRRHGNRRARDPAGLDRHILNTRLFISETYKMISLPFSNFRA